MTTHIIDRPSVKLLLRVIGIPLSVLALLGAIDSLGLLLGGIAHNNPWALFFGLGSIGAGLGIVGGWLRLSQGHDHLSKKRVRIVRWLLTCGILGAAFLAVGAYGIFGVPLGYFGAIFILLGALGAACLHQTPAVL
jgi:hypothetical protein